MKNNRLKKEWNFQKEVGISIKKTQSLTKFLLRNYLLLLVRGDAEYYFVL